MVGIMFTGYWSSTHKQKDAQTEVQDAWKDLHSVQKNDYATAQAAINAEEWKTFRSESELKIKAIEIRIIELNVKMENPGEIFDALYVKEIAILEQQSKDMRASLEAYQKSRCDWTNID